MCIRRTPNLRSPLAFVPESVLIPAEIGGIPVYLHDHLSEVQRRPGPDNPQWKIPRFEWSDVLCRVDHGETYRQIASHYGVSYEVVRLCRIEREVIRATAVVRLSWRRPIIGFIGRKEVRIRKS
jgi:hypothetical protein